MCAPEVPPVAAAPFRVGPKRPVSEEDVKQVHILLEACIQRCMTKKHAVAALSRLGVEARFSLLGTSMLISEQEFAGFVSIVEDTCEHHRCVLLTSECSTPLLLQCGKDWRRKIPSSLNHIMSS